jgi:hypothetical protein
MYSTFQWQYFLLYGILLEPVLDNSILNLRFILWVMINFKMLHVIYVYHWQKSKQFLFVYLRTTTSVAAWCWVLTDFIKQCKMSDISDLLMNTMKSC